MIAEPRSSEGVLHRLARLRASARPAVAGDGPIPAVQPERAETGVHRRRTVVPLGWPDGLPAGGGVVAELHALARAPELRGLGLGDLVFVDVETTGVGAGAGVVAWLIGTARLETNGPAPGGRGPAMVLEQAWIESFGAEADLLAGAAAVLSRAEALVTFNGRAFDIPLLRSRCVLHGLAPPPDRPHLDLLAPSRRMWGCHLPDARQASIEARVLGLPRADDIPGSEIPAAFLACVRLGLREGLLRAVDHNARDVEGMGRILLALLSVAGSAAPGQPCLPFDPLGLAEHHAWAGRVEAACRGLADHRRDVEAGSTRRMLRAARLARCLQGRAAAATWWRGACARADAPVHAWEEWAKSLEHDEGDALAARHVVTRALLLFADRPAARERLRHRLSRLDHRLARGPDTRDEAPRARTLPAEPHPRSR